MKTLQPILFGFGLAMNAAVFSSLEAKPAFESGHYRNLFAEHLGKTEVEVDAKLAAVWQQYTAGDTDTQRLFYTVPGDMAYVPDIKNKDVRTEGQSYGMMIAVQLNQQEEFNRIWKWTKTYMFHREGKYAGYYAWHCRSNGTQINAGPAPDGEEWFVMSLFFAAHRWGNGEGIFNYEAEAQTLLRHMLHNNEGGDDSVTPMFNRKEYQVVFTPHAPGSSYTDPSYHLPAFYELWARWASDSADREFLARLAPTSRLLFKRAAHPQTGLMPDYTSFDGKPFVKRGHENFLFDAFRTIGNVALDYSWFGRDEWQVAQSNRVLAFLAAQGPDCPNNFTLEGKPLSKDFSPGLFAMAAVGALAADSPDAKLFVQRLWDMPIPSGVERYYDGLLYTLSLLQVSGRFQIHAPAGGHNAIGKPSAFDNLQKGMTGEQVRKLLGEPKQIKPFKARGEQSFIWVYNRIVSETTHQIPVGTISVPIVNPLTGASRLSGEVVYGPEFVTVSKTIELLVIEDQLIQWKRTPKVDRHI